MVICFTEVRFLQTYSPLRWSQRPGLFQPFPSLKRSPRPSELFSLINGSLRPLTRTTTTWYLLLDYKLLENKNGGRRKVIQATRTQMNTNISLSLVTNCSEWFRTWERIWSLVCFLEWSLELLYWMQWLKNWMPWSVVVGVFIAPTTKMAVGEAGCRWAHRTDRCATRHCPVRQPHHPTVRVRPLELWQLGPPDSPVVHQTVTVHCPARLLMPALTLCALFAYCSAFTGFRWSRPLRCSRYSAGTPDSPVNYSGVAFPETRRWRVWVDSPWCIGHCPVAHQTVRCARPGRPSVCFAPFFLNPILDFLLVCIEPLAPVELII
jgi:hypothetical protein